MAHLTTDVLFCLLLCLVRTESNQTKLDFFLQENENVRPRIVEGQEAVAHDFPYQAALHVEIPDQTYLKFCGGSLISELFVLTAGHCLYGASRVLVILGAHDVEETEASQQRQYSQQLLVHKDYNPANSDNDIALITLPNKVEFTAAVQPVILPKRSDSWKWLIFAEATVSGWGRTSGSSALSPVLRFVKAKIIPTIICSTLYIRILQKRICLSGKFGRSACQGDSGGPLVLKKKVGYVQHGITSFGIAGCQSGYPSVFTKVSSYLHWIQSNTGILIRS